MSTQAELLTSANHETPRSQPRNRAEEPKPFLLSLWNYAIVGGGAALLLAMVELLDLNVRLAPILQSVAERAIFCSYFSLNLVGGTVLGLFVGLFVKGSSLLKRQVQRALARGQDPRLVHRMVAGAAVYAIAAFLLNQQPQIHGHTIEVIRQIEKFEVLRNTLLSHERSASYLLLMAFVAGCSVLCKASRRLRSSSTIVRTVGITVLMSIIACAYYVDSRFETPLYGIPLHRSLFVICTAVSMALVGAISLRSASGSTRGSSRAKAASLLFAVGLGACVVFTFLNIDRNQNLKTQIFFRTTQARQHFKLAQWVLDFDRDGYSAFLGGGDCDDRREDINPGRLAVVDDGVDHNCVGGALTRQGIDDWKNEHSARYPRSGPPAQQLNVIYVFIDALRRDHMGAYGYARNTSPNLDRLAARSSLFENAFTPAPNTFEALPKFTQGTYWDAHVEGWPEIMARNGYNAILFPRRISTLRRHVKGMRVADRSTDGSFEATIDSAIDVLGKTPRDRPFCAYVYSTDTHRPYSRHKEFNYGSSLIDLYDGEISYLDSHLGRLFDWMEESGRMQDTMIVIMSDHGESLGERGVFKHSTLLYNEQARVPMIIYMPGLEARSIENYVTTVDLGPTMLDAVGLEYPKECAGVSLVPLMKGEHFTHPPVYAEQTTHDVSPYVRADQNISPAQKKYMIITQDGFKLIYNRDHSCFELFDLKNDPTESLNLYDRMPLVASDLKRRLGRFIDVVTVSRPWDADESQYFFGPTGEAREAK